MYKSKSKGRLCIKLKLYDTKVIEDDLALKILEWWSAPDSLIKDNINKVKGPVCNEISTMKPNLPYLNMKQRKEIVYSKAISIA